MGRLEAAAAAARRLIALPRSDYLGEKDTLADNLAGCYATGRRLLFETLARHERWQQIVDEVDAGMLAAGSGWEEQAHAIYWKGLALLNLGRAEAAAEQAEALDALFNRFRTEGTTNEIKEEIIRCIRGLRACRGLAAKSLPSAPDTAREPILHVTDDHLSRLLFDAGFQGEALALAARHREERPGQLLATANFCDLHARAGQRDKALIHFDSQFRRNATEADADLAVFARVMPMVQALNLRGNWKLPPLAMFDKAAFPAPDTLGPVAWRPPEAPPFSLPDHSGKKIALEDYRGRPLLLNFFLGVGCVFCAEQLQVFKPHVAAFEEAGIAFVAVSIDSVEGLANSIGTAIAEGGKAADPYPFPVVSDERLDVFKAYRAYSAFEESGLHGTFLISPDGRILWHNISHEPFMFPEFLLGEARRMLALHGGKKQP
jgi:peroxiredoxin